MAYRIVKFRRRREGKTDYKARLGMLKSGMPRIVIRKTNRYVLLQLVESREAKDYVLCVASSSELLKHGWPDSAKGSLKSVPAAYLAGYLLGSKIKKLNKSNISEAIADTGLARSTKGSRIYAAVKGLIDAGIKLPCSKDILPSDDRLNGKHMKKQIDTAKIRENIK